MEIAWLRIQLTRREGISAERLRYYLRARCAKSRRAKFIGAVTFLKRRATHPSTLRTDTHFLCNATVCPASNRQPQQRFAASLP